MPEQIEVSGESFINDKFITDKFKIYLSKYGLDILNIPQPHDHNKNINIYCFNISMLNALDHRNIVNPIEYIIEGTKLGGYSETFDAKEGDIDFRPITKIQIKIIHTRISINFEIEGLATIENGYIKNNGYGGSPLGDWNFSLSFSIPIESVSEFIDNQNTERNYYVEAMEKL